jgi:hypothetical protein
MVVLDRNSQNDHRRPPPSNTIMIEHSCFSDARVGGVLVASSSSCLPPSPASTPTLNSPKKRKIISRRVSFGPTETLAFIETRSIMTEQDKDCRWFQAQELQNIKTNARHLCIQESKGLDVPHDESTRGMDVYLPSRQRHHKKFIDHVLEAYHFRCAGDSEHVRLLVERWSIKSRKRATDRAQQDYMEVYSL